MKIKVGQVLYQWFNERIPLDPLVAFLNKPVPKKLGWGYCLGSIVLTLIIIQLVTGIVMMMYYAPTPDHAHDSVEYIQNEVMFGKFIRGLHVWGSSFIVVLVVAHLLHVLFTGGYKKPKQLTWIIGVLMGLVIFGFAFTGYLLPWDQKAYWATMVGTQIAGTVPIIGEYQLKLIRAGEQLGALTLTRFFSAHVILLPAVFIGLVTLHLFLVRRLGVTRYDQNEPIPDSEKEPFFPNQALKDLFASLVIVSILFFIAWKFPASLEKVADPTDKGYIPRPEWYFLFLFQMLHYFEGKYEIIGTVIIPTGAVLLLLFLPFIDRRPERSPRKRPLVVGFASLVTASIIFLTIEGALQKPPEIKEIPEFVEAGTELSLIEQAGKNLYIRLHCAECHQVNRVGGKIGPELTNVGKRRTADWMISHFKNPQAIAPGFKMPVFEVSDEELSALSAYLLRLRGPGSVPSPELVEIKEAGLSVLNIKQGERIFQLNRCAACHKVNNVGGVTASDLSDLALRRNQEWLRLFMDKPEVMVESQFGHPLINLTVAEKELLFSYLSSLTTQIKPTDKSSRTATQPEDMQILTMTTSTSSLMDTTKQTGVVISKPLTPRQLVERGKQIYEIQGCTQCHVIGDIGGFVGPDLTLVGTKYDRDWHYRHFENPRAVSPGSVMPEVHLPKEDMDALVEYIMSLQ